MPYNPFTRSNALPQDHPLFRGREAELDRLERACVNQHGPFMLVYGGRQNGKSTLLRQLEKRLNQQGSTGLRVCRVDFQRAPRASSQEVYRLLAQSLALVLPQPAPQPGTLDALALGDFLEQSLAGAGVRRLVLLLDELGSLPEATRVDLAHVLRGLHTSQRDSAALSKFQAVLFGGIELYDLAVVHASTLRNVCEQVPLGDLAEGSALALLADGLALAGLDADRAAALGRAVYARVGGHPYLTQRLGEQLAEQVLAGTQPDEAAVDALAWELLEQADPLLEHLRHALAELRLEDAARRLLSVCQRTSRTDDATARLELLGLARRDKRYWVPRNALLALALAEWLGVPVPVAAGMPGAAVAVQRAALAVYQDDLKLQQRVIAQRVLVSAPIEEHLWLQRRAKELTDEIARVAAMPLPPWVPALVKVPAGPFLMGSSDSDIMAASDEKPQHCLELPDFWIGMTFVTNAQFRPFVEGDGYTNRAYWTKAGWQWRQQEGITQPENWTDRHWSRDDQPVIGVSWFEAVAYCRWLRAQTGLPFRLPSEAEREKAARGPNGLIWPWGNLSEELAELTSPVGQYSSKVSYYGALDMSGNVVEWCATHSGKKYPYQLEDEWTDAYLEGDDGRVQRGGSWCDEEDDKRGAYRNAHNPRGRYIDLGFRVACSSPRPAARY